MSKKTTLSEHDFEKMLCLGCSYGTGVDTFHAKYQCHISLRHRILGWMRHIKRWLFKVYND